MDINNIRHIRAGLLNVQSVGNKTHQIRDLINTNKLDIFMLTETWLSAMDSAKIAEMSPATHAFFHVPREGRTGGGVGIFITNSFKHIRLEKVNICSSFEHMKVSFRLGAQRFVCVVVYRPPGLDVGLFLTEFESVLETLDTVSENILVCGDFNIWMDDKENRYSVAFSELLDSYQLQNGVMAPTSVSGHVLDLVIFDSVHNLIENIKVDEVCTISPVHRYVSFEIPVEISKRQTVQIRYRNKRSLNSDLFIENSITEVNTLSNADCIHGHEKMDECTHCYTGLYNNAVKANYNSTCPLIEKEIVVHDNAPWFNLEVKRAQLEKRRCERKWRSRRSDEARQAYRHARDNEDIVITNRKKAYYTKKLHEAFDDIKKLYKILDELVGNRKKSKLPEGYADDELAEMFAEFFTDKINDIVNTFTETPDGVSYFPNVQRKVMSRFRLIHLEKLKSILSRVRYTYCDNDPVNIADIAGSERFDELLMVLLNIINLCIRNNNFPDSEKMAIIRPIIKGALDSQILSSYRPISNLTFLSKVLEAVILDQLLEFLVAEGLIPDWQSAYREKYSTETVLCSIVNDLITLMDDSKCGIILLLDLSAAFDTVVHELLLHDLHTIGIRDDALQLLANYLTGRTYCVQVGQSLSRPKKLERGVPQGSVLGPVLFCIYTIELSWLLEKHEVGFRLYADDTQFYLVLNNINVVQNKINDIMKDVKNWMNKKQLKLNETKTECLIVGRDCDLNKLDDIQNIMVNDVQIAVRPAVKDLGVTLDRSLSMNTQINNVVRLAGYNLRNIAFLKKYVNEDMIRRMVQNFVISRLDYCNSIYYGLPKFQLKKLQKILNRSVRLIKGLSPQDRITPAMIDLHWLPVKARLEYKINILTYQALKFGKPKYIRDLLSEFSTNSHLILRHNVERHRLNEPRFNHAFGTRAFRICAPRLFNRVPVNIKDCNTLESFKSKLKTFLFNKCYDLDEKVIKENYRV